jgi:leukotriene-A4 hydrolase
MPHMRQRRLLLSLVTLLFLVAAKHRAVHHPTLLPGQPPVDVWTYSNASAVTTRHIALDLTVDFETKQLRGSATHTIENLTGATTLVLDTERLAISSVTLDGTTPALWSLGQETYYGRPLVIGIQPSTRTVTINYSTNPAASGLFWNTAMQSYGRQQPYLYTQNEPVSARSWIPVQDSPSTRMTYEATLRVPPQLLALMSAENNPTSLNATGVYTFRMTKTIPAYLIALAVGRLEFRAFDSRSGVYAEPELMDDAVWELQYIPAMMTAAESIAGPYPFVRYDVLLMPPTYELGGMEHPMLNFIHPFAVVTGNRPSTPQPTNLIAHELAHSWAGDLVTLATWDDVWLNEGITAYLTLRIMEMVAGPERAELSYFLDRRSYTNYSKGTNNPELTVLHRTVHSPGEGFDLTGYTKGELFMRTLEDRLGRSTMDAFLKRWFARFAWRWVDDVAFVVTLNEFVPPGTDLRLMEWLYQPGLPSNVTAATSSAMYVRAEQRGAAFRNGTAIAQLAPSTWSDLDLELFLQVVPPTIYRPRIGELDGAFQLSSRNTPNERWLASALREKYAPAMPAVERALRRGGPNGTIVGLYSILRDVDIEYGRTMFESLGQRYHKDVREVVESILKGTNSIVDEQPSELRILEPVPPEQKPGNRRAVMRSLRDAA